MLDIPTIVRSRGLSKTRNSSLLVLIPAYNEEQSVAEVIQGVRETLPETPIVVVDDGSLDGTAHQARQAGAEVIQLPHHLGLGGAVQTGYKFAFEHGFQRVVRVDGDGQHNAADIPALLAKMDEGDYDVVTGSRYIKKNGYSWHPIRRLGGLIFTTSASPTPLRASSPSTAGRLKSAAAVFLSNTPRLKLSSC